MKKTQAVNIFGDTQKQLAQAVNLTPARICQWPDVLGQVEIDRVLGAAVRLGVPVPNRYFHRQLRARRGGRRR